MMLVSIKNNNSIMDKPGYGQDYHYDYVRHVSNNALPTGQKADLSALRVVAGLLLLLLLLQLQRCRCLCCCCLAWRLCACLLSVLYVGQHLHAV